jgi:hypothetical protein
VLANCQRPTRMTKPALGEVRPSSETFNFLWLNDTPVFFLVNFDREGRTTLNAVVLSGHFQTGSAYQLQKMNVEHRRTKC